MKVVGVGVQKELELTDLRTVVLDRELAPLRLDAKGGINIDVRDYGGGSASSGPVGAAAAPNSSESLAIGASLFRCPVLRNWSVTTFTVSVPADSHGTTG